MFGFQDRETMTRRATHIRQGATQVVILAIYLEYYVRPRQQELKGVIDALSIASATNQPNLQWYGYHGGRLLGFPKEYLIPNGIPEEAVVAWIPAKGRPFDIPIHLGTMEIPEALVVDAGGSRDFKIWNWAEDEIYTRTGVRSLQMVQRLMRALCVEASDYDVGQ
ncbi:hypothetical protein LTR82_017628 [Friedmanniomyces endolithicus]|uniref:Uncharacterized protein n=1 Tax=Friedmanniomyces endolithicus TaxID=329885 RepID=A0AAN6IZK0_9PEZI|nr:hypothetical protein LTR82_017628 [Friedmanniomyces endolithicus]